MTTTPRNLALLRTGAWAGLIGPVFFVSVFTLEGWLRPGYDPASTFISALSLGPRGGIQIASFLLTGACFLLFARGLRSQFPGGKASRAGPVLMAFIGVGLFASGPCVMDPMGTPFPQSTWHGLAHNVLGAVVFSLGPVSLFVFFRRFRADPDWRPLAAWTLAAGATMTAADVVLKLATLPLPAPPSPLAPWAGVIQRVAIASLMAWVASVSVGMLRRRHPPGAPLASSAAPSLGSGDVR
jgi:Protein of unknown function (DUF998)